MPKATCLGHKTRVLFRAWERRRCPNPRLPLDSSGGQSRAGSGTQRRTLACWEETARSRSHRGPPPTSCPPRPSEIPKAGREDLGVASRASPSPRPPAGRHWISPTAERSAQARGSNPGGAALPRASRHPRRVPPRSWGARSRRPARCLTRRPRRPASAPGGTSPAHLARTALRRHRGGRGPGAPSLAPSSLRLSRLPPASSAPLRTGSDRHR